MTILTIQNIQQLVQKIGFDSFILGLISYLETDFKDWAKFEKTARLGFYKNDGVLELMPICSDTLFSFKYVNGHPNNTKINKLTVLGLGMLAEVATGIPLLVSEMTLLTALRTAATSAMASKYLANQTSKNFGIIGCGSQSEFQTLAHRAVLGVEKVFYFDTDAKAMTKFASNLKNHGFELIACKNAENVCQNSQIITTCTATPGKHQVLLSNWIRSGQHLNCIGGDSPDKTELEVDILKKAKIVVEYFEQTKDEGEIQNLANLSKDDIAAELWEIISGQKIVRAHASDITLYDSVGFALEDYSVLRYVYDLSQIYGIFTELDLIPDLEDCKNLYSKISAKSKTSAYIGQAENYTHNNLI